jgi:hypothetical protein
MSLKVVVAILLIAAVPVCADAQNPKVSKGDTEKIVTIISGDKIKTQAYCDIHKLAQQLVEAHVKKDGEKVNELFGKIQTLEKTVGPEYVALVGGLRTSRKTKSSVQSFRRHLGHSSGCVRGRSRKPGGRQLSRTTWGAKRTSGLLRANASPLELATLPRV